MKDTVQLISHTMIWLLLLLHDLAIVLTIERGCRTLACAILQRVKMSNHYRCGFTILRFLFYSQKGNLSIGLTDSKLSEPIRTYPNLSEPFRTYANLSELFWTYPDLSKPIPTYPNLSNIIWTCLWLFFQNKQLKTLNLSQLVSNSIERFQSFFSRK